SSSRATSRTTSLCRRRSRRASRSSASSSRTSTPRTSSPSRRRGLLAPARPDENALASPLDEQRPAASGFGRPHLEPRDERQQRHAAEDPREERRQQRLKDERRCGENGDAGRARKD